MATILIIEDEKLLREELLQILALEGYTGIGAPDGRVGVNIIKSQRPDLVLCDIMMPVLDGYGVLEEIRADRATDNIPFVFMSAKARPGESITGISDYIEKPATIQAILDVIEKIYQNKAESPGGLRGNASRIHDIFVFSTPSQPPPTSGEEVYWNLVARIFVVIYGKKPVQFENKLSVIHPPEIGGNEGGSHGSWIDE